MRILNIYCQAVFSLFQFYLRLRCCGLGRGGSEAMRMQLASERIKLRALLRRFPNWAYGHLKLGETERELFRFSGTGNEARDYSVIQISGLAAKRLLEGHVSAANLQILERAEKLIKFSGKIS